MTESPERTITNDRPPCGSAVTARCMAGRDGCSVHPYGNDDRGLPTADELSMAYELNNEWNDRAMRKFAGERDYLATKTFEYFDQTMARYRQDEQTADFTFRIGRIYQSGYALLSMWVDPNAKLHDAAVRTAAILLAHDHALNLAYGHAS